ncbi:response regulator, partial [Nonomuraea lactucae]|uniref:response regulator n=1 Tax=Nonomuraea lactucae TaxID=2249762 RepID=UPI0013B384E3
MIRVLVADDQALVRAGVRMLLQAAGDMEVVAEAADGAEAVRQAERHLPDVILMDLRMPRVDGLEATRRVLAARPASRVVVLTTFAEDANVHAALRAGAVGFLVKDDEPERMVDAVRRASAGEQLLAPSVLRRVVEGFLAAGERAGADPFPAGLTERELEVLALVGTGLSNAEIAEELHVGVTTVKTHLAAAMDKLGLRNRIQAAVLAHRGG